MHTALEAQAEAVARDVQPESQADGDKGGITEIIALIMTIIQSIISACPKPPSQVKADFKRPSLRQRAYVMKTTNDACRCCNMTQHAGKIYGSLLRRGAAMQDADAGALIEECQADSNLLI